MEDSMLRSSMVFVCLSSLTAIANAQPADPTTVSTTAVAPAPIAAPSTGMTLRNGFSLSAGQEFGTTIQMQDFSGQLFGVDWRIGMQITPAIAVYLDSHLSFGTVAPNSGGGGGVTGNFASAVIGEYTLPMRVFLGGGAGYGVLNNPNGPLVQARIGYYPFKNTSAAKTRRLNVAL